MGICALTSNSLNNGDDDGGNEYDDEEGVEVPTCGMHLYNFSSAITTIATMMMMMQMILLMLR